MVTRFPAYCLEYTEGIELTEGVAAGDQPAIVVRDLRGRTTAWIEVGSPDAQRLHRGSKLAGRAAVYTHRPASQLLADLNGGKIHRASAIPVYEFGRGFIDSVAAVVPRRAEVSVSITGRQLYLDIGGGGGPNPGIPAPPPPKSPPPGGFGRPAAGGTLVPSLNPP